MLPKTDAPQKFQKCYTVQRGSAVVDSCSTAVVYVLHKSIISIHFNSKSRKYLLNRYGIKLKYKK